MTDPSEPSIDAYIDTPPPEAVRKATIAAAVRDPRSMMFVPLEGEQREIPVVWIGEDQLVYRAANGRIVTELREHAARTGGDLARLLADQASLPTQRLLHALLAAKAADPSGPVLQELARHGRQTEPLLVTAEGVLVNGNRRLAAMRSLRDQDPDRYSGFATVMAGVLPADIGERDIEFIEASLQMAPEVKLAYGWVNRRMKLRHQRDDLNLSREAIADAYRMETLEQVDREIGELALAEIYLDDFKGQPGGYSLLGAGETLFESLHRQLEELPPPLRAAWRTAGFVMIDGREAVKGPMDRFFPFAPPAPASLPLWTLRRWGEAAGVVEPVDGKPASNRPAPLSDEALAGVQADLRTDDSRTTAKALAALMDQLRAEHSEDRAPHQAIKLVTRARNALSGVEPGRLSAKQIRELQAEITALSANVNALATGEPLPPPPASSRPGLLGKVLRRLT